MGGKQKGNTGGEVRVDGRARGFRPKLGAGSEAWGWFQTEASGASFSTVANATPSLCIPPGRRLVLTNSHVVSNATAVYLRRPGVAKKFKAEVLAEAKV